MHRDCKWVTCLTHPLPFRPTLYVLAATHSIVSTTCMRNFSTASEKLKINDERLWFYDSEIAWLYGISHGINVLVLDWSDECYFLCISFRNDVNEFNMKFLKVFVGKPSAWDWAWRRSRQVCDPWPAVGANAILTRSWRFLNISW